MDVPRHFSRHYYFSAKFSGNPRMSSNLLLYAMFFHVCWMALLYVALTVLRAPSIWGLDTASGTIRKWSVLEPRVSANLSNQFEWPLLFYVCCLLIINGGGIANNAQIILAWIFVAGRIIHSLVQIFTNNIRLRGAVFTINFLAVFFMWITLIIANS